MRSVSLKLAQKSDYSIYQLFKVLCLVANALPQPSVPLIDSLVDDAVLSKLTDRSAILHSYFAYML